jgi:PAS domain S-box-containing protein
MSRILRFTHQFIDKISLSRISQKVFKYASGFNNRPGHNKNTMEYLSENEEIFHNLFENNSTAIAIIEKDTTISMVNDAYCKISGYKREEIIGKSWTQQIPPEDIERLKEYNRKRLINPRDAPKNYEFTFYHKNGEIRNCLMSVTMIRGGSKIISSFTDITDNKRAEAALQESEALLTAFMNFVPALILIKDHELRPIFANSNYKQYFPADEWLGKKPHETFPPEIADLMVAKDTEALEKGYVSYEETWTDKENIQHIFFTQKFRIDNPEKKPLLGAIISDITERREADEHIRVSEARLKRAELASKSGNWELHLDSQKMIASEGAVKLYGVDKDQFEYAVIKKVPLPEYRPLLDTALRNLMENNIPYDIEFKIKVSDTDEIKDIHSVALYDKAKRIVFGVIQDITEQKQTEIELTKAKDKAEESDRLKTAFLHNITHEIRTPMNAIIGFCGLINVPDLSLEKRLSFTDIIVQSSNQLLSIITDIVSIATIEAGQEKLNIKVFNINSMCKLVNEQFFSKARRQGITLRYKTNLTHEKAFINTDETKLVQILTNLIGNALKFTERGSVDFGYSEKENELEFYIKDTGIGIPQELQKEIFNRFRQVEDTATRQYGGSGLGLSISKAYVEMLGGRIWLTSQLEKGSQFYFTIPFKKNSSDDILLNDHSDVSKIEIENPITILVVEDEEINTFLLDELLSGVNITIVHAAHGIEAIELCKKNPNIDLVLMDLKMPVMDGYEATKQIKEFRPDLPVIAQTAYSDELDRRKAIACGCSDFIIKPYTKELLISKINQSLIKA